MKPCTCELCGSSFDGGYGDFSEFWRIAEIPGYEGWVAKACDGCIYKIEMALPGGQLTAEWVSENAHRASEHHFMLDKQLVTVKCIICDLLGRGWHGTCGHWRATVTYVSKLRLH